VAAVSYDHRKVFIPVCDLMWCIDLLETNGDNNMTAMDTSAPRDTSQTGASNTGVDNISTSDPTPPTTDPAPSNTDSVPSTGDPTPSTSSHTDGGCPAAEAGNDEETYLVKPLLSPLYSINPFCVPVKYLGLRTLNSH